MNISFVDGSLDVFRDLTANKLSSVNRSMFEGLSHLTRLCVSAFYDHEGSPNEIGYRVMQTTENCTDRDCQK